MSAVAELSDPGAILLPNGSKARYGVSYVRNICAQAGVGLNETAADEDVLAVDCDVKFLEADVRVQVKCTGQFTLAAKQASWKVEQSWVDVWGKAKVPVYFVLVIVKGDAHEWLHHRPTGTIHNAAAFWRRVDGLPPETTSLTIAKKQRLTAATVQQWHNDLLACFAPAAS
jgi:hypothetical protein